MSETKNLSKALLILSKYTRDRVDFQYDMLVVEVDKPVSGEDAAKLDALGWVYNEAECGWCYGH